MAEGDAMKTEISKKSLWGGRVISGLPVLFLLFDSTVKLLAIAPVREAHARLGYAPDVARTLGLVELACLLLYLFPRTATLGAVLLTGWLGGAIATHVRIADP